MSEVANSLVKHIILWNGGWDEYLVDMNQTIDLPPEYWGVDRWKKDIRGFYRKNGEEWLPCHELNHDWYNDKELMPNPSKGFGVHPNSKGVRILRHLRGGD